MTTETTVKPLHVMVAEALGDDLGPCSARYIEDQLESGRGDSGWYCNDCGFSGEYAKDGPQSYEHSRPAREYDTNWCLTGPLIERLGLGIECHDGNEEDYRWCAAKEQCATHSHDPSEPWTHASTPLVAVCKLILALHEAGDLTAAPPSQRSAPQDP